MAEPSLSLPFPGVGSPQPESINLLRRMYPDEELIVGAAAKCRALDEEALEEATRRLGDAGAMRLAAQQGRWATFLEADWIASDKALYYVIPGPESVFRCPWEAVSRVKLGRKKRLPILPYGDIAAESRQGRHFKIFPETKEFEMFSRLEAIGELLDLIEEEDEIAKKLRPLGPRVLQVVRIQFAAGGRSQIQIEVEIGRSSAQNLLAVWSHFRAK